MMMTTEPAWNGSCDGNMKLHQLHGGHCRRATDPDRLIYGMPPDQPSFGSFRDRMHIRTRGYLQLGI